jgi:hypothetical protein
LAPGNLARGIRRKELVLAITITCPQCAHTVKASDGLAGKKVQCPKCQRILTIPAPKPALVGAAASAGTTTAASPSRAVAAVPTAVPAAPAAPAVDVREKVLAALQGKIALPPVSFVRKLGTFLILAILLAIVAVSVAAFGGLVWLLVWLVTSDLSGQLPQAAVTLAIAAVAIVIVCLIRPLVMPQHKSHALYPLSSSQEKLLTDFVGKLCEQVDCQPPAVVQAECSPRLALDRGGRKLTIGLALTSGLSVEQLGGLIVGQLAQHRRRAASGPTNLIRAINGWYWRSVFQQDRFDQWITRVNLRPGFHLGRLVLPLRALSFVGRAALWLPMFLGNSAATGLVRRTELDADLCSARLIGRNDFARLLERVKLVEYTWEGIFPELKFLYSEQKLPDSLPHELANRLAELAPEVSATLLESVITSEVIPFDSRPSESERLAAVEGEQTDGVLACPLPAHVLWSDYGKLAREATFDYYSASFSAQHIKTALRRVT